MVLKQVSSNCFFFQKSIFTSFFPSFPFSLEWCIAHACAKVDFTFFCSVARRLGRKHGRHTSRLVRGHPTSTFRAVVEGECGRPGTCWSLEKRCRCLFSRCSPFSEVLVQAILARAPRRPLLLRSPPGQTSYALMSLLHRSAEDGRISKFPTVGFRDTSPSSGHELFPSATIFILSSFLEVFSWNFGFCGVLKRCGSPTCTCTLSKLLAKLNEPGGGGSREGRRSTSARPLAGVEVALSPALPPQWRDPGTLGPLP